MMEEHSIQSDGRAVWINNAVGLLGRFSKNGIDVHHDAVKQPDGHCLDCRAGPTLLLADWRAFQSSMMAHHGISVSDKHAPKFILEQL